MVCLSVCATHTQALYCAAARDERPVFKMCHARGPQVSVVQRLTPSLQRLIISHCFLLSRPSQTQCAARARWATTTRRTRAEEGTWGVCGGWEGWGCVVRQERAYATRFSLTHARAFNVCPAPLLTTTPTHFPPFAQHPMGRRDDCRARQAAGDPAKGMVCVSVLDSSCLRPSP